MKKKIGELSPVVTTLITVLLVIVVFGITWVVVKNVIEGETHFKITKEECRNETSQVFNGTFNWGGGASPKYIPCEVRGVNNKIYKIRNCEEKQEQEPSKLTIIDITEEVCEQVEVDEFCFWHPELEDSLLLENVQIGGCEQIRKKDLTTELLNGNCECHKLGEGKILCSEYKCGDYQVEMWKQLK